jgi:hypothetical protein
MPAVSSPPSPPPPPSPLPRPPQSPPPLATGYRARHLRHLRHRNRRRLYHHTDRIPPPTQCVEREMRREDAQRTHRHDDDGEAARRGEGGWGGGDFGSLTTRIRKLACQDT